MKKLLISVLALVMSVSVALGLTACSNGPSDEEIATKAIDTVNVLYVDSAASTPDDYTVIGQARVDDKLYPIDWSVSPDSAKEYAKVGAMDETTKMVTIDITRTTVDVEYTLKASITVGSVTKTTEFKHSIPKKSSEDAVTATLDFSVKDNRTSLDLDNNEQVWKQNGVTLTNTGNVADYSNPIRLYKNTTVSIEMENAKIIHIDFHSAQGFDDSPYPEYLKTSLEDSDLPIKGEVTVSEDGLTFGVDFETPQEVVTFKTTAGQCRLTSIDVEAIERDPNEHVHKWTYEHVANTWTHTATCTAEGCDVKTKTEACTPKLNVCECGYTYTAKEIVDALFALETGKSLPGTYSLTGLVTKVTELDTSNYKNVTFDMTVEGQTVTVFRAKGSHYADVREGGYATVNGELLDYNGTKEFTQGGSVVEFSDERTAQQKVDAALKALADTVTITKAGDELPASTETDVTFTWALKSGETLPEGVTFANGKLTVTKLPATDTTVKFVVTATCGTETVTNNTKEVTVTIKAEGSEVEGFTPITAPAAGSDYYLAMDINGTWYYSTGAKSGNYLGTTTDISKAAKVTVAASGSGWTLVTNGKYIELETSEPNSEGKTYVNIMLKDAQTTGKVWMWNAQYAVFTMEEGGATYFLGTYGTFNTFNSANITYIENDNEYIGKIGTYTGEVTPPTPSDADAMLSFADVANRTEVSTEKQVWKQNGITFTNEKGASTSDVNEKYYGPIRLYKSSSVKIEYTSAMKAIVFHCNTADYANTLKSSLTGTGFTVTVDGLDVTVTLDTPSTTFEFTASAGQIRIDSIEVYTKAPAGKTDAEKVADVKAALKLSKTQFTTVGEEVELPATQGEATLTWAISGTSDLVKIDGGKLVVLKLPAADTVVTLTVTITVGGASDTADVKITVKAEGTEPQPSGTLENPLTVAEATAIIAGLGTETVYKVNGEIALVYVKGIVTVKGTTDDYGIKNYFMADVAGDTANDISLYSLNWGTVKKGTEINVGDTIIVTGYLQNYGGTYEVSSYKDTTWHNGTVEAHTPAGGEVTPPTPSEADATISFSDIANRTEVSTEKQVWKQNGVTVTVLKGNASSNINEQYFNPLRIYQNHVTKVEYVSAMTKLVFHCAANSYTTPLQNSLANVAGVTVTVDDADVTVTLDAAATSLEFTASAQIRVNSIDIYAGEGGGTVDPDPKPPVEGDVTATLSFADKALNRTEFSTSKQVWQQNGVTLTNAGSVGDYANPVRFYKNSTVKIEYTSAMTKIVFHCGTYQDNDYPGTLKSSLTGTGFTVTVDGLDVTVTLDTPSTSFEFTASAGQIRVDSIDVYAGGAQPEEPGTSVTFTQQQQGTFKCSMKPGESGAPDSELDASDVPDLVVSEHGITWGDKVITNLQAMEGDPNSFTFQIGNDNYGLNFTGAGWMLVKLDKEGMMEEGYVFGDMGGFM